MKIITLAENLVYNNKLIAEHGFSLYIESGGKKILFDTGQSGLFIQNARQLGIDIADVDILVLSHGHYDHTGGLDAFMEVNSKAEILAKEEIFIPKYSGKSRFIGISCDEVIRSRVSFVSTVKELVKDVYVVTDIKLYHPEDTNFRKFYKKQAASFYPDEFEDELFIAIRQNNMITIITACSHRGITNICENAVRYFDLPVHMIIGGFHMKDCEERQYQWIVQYLRNIRPDMVGVSHCTGVDKYAALAKDLDTKIFYNYTGNEITIKDNDR